MWWIIPVTLLATYISATLYRLGGASKQHAKEEYGWLPEWFRNLPKKRDAGCGIVTGLLMFLLLFKFDIQAAWWLQLIAHLLAFGTLWGALSTYHDTMFYNPMKPDDNFWMHGFCWWLAGMWYCLVVPQLWWLLLIRAVVMAIFMGVWCHVLFSDAWWEENGRGGIILATLPIILI